MRRNVRNSTFYFSTCVPNENSNQPAHSRSLIWVFIVRMKKFCILGYHKYYQWRFWSDCANLNLRWAHARRHVFWRCSTYTYMYMPLTIRRTLTSENRLPHNNIASVCVIAQSNHDVRGLDTFSGKVKLSKLVCISSKKGYTLKQMLTFKSRPLC